ncbi:uncharacterized protein Dvar_82320 [Desulfosarcina variabilis str. Montpellier]|uniref:hypothetical protein n=1 Tax=Desulfosarcina variabilis TaxID=2300 RepID=UPI003AFA5BA7
MISLSVRNLALMVVLIILPMAAEAYEEVEDLVEIFVTDNQFTASVDGRRAFPESIKPGENVLWEGAKGEVGAILTNERLLAVSITSGGWNMLDLKIREKRSTPEMLLAAHLVVMLTDERIVALGTYTDGFFQTPMPIGESVVASQAEGRVAAVVTSSRAYGFSAYRRGAAEIRLKRQEEIVAIKATYNKITLQTSENRALILRAKDARWSRVDLD